MPLCQKPAIGLPENPQWVAVHGAAAVNPEEHRPPSGEVAVGGVNLQVQTILGGGAEAMFSVATVTVLWPSAVRSFVELAPMLMSVVVEGDGAWLRVADKRVDLEQGKAILFDDSFEHEAGNDNPLSPRVVLVVDIWHPDLTDEEIKFLSFVNKGQINAAKKMKDLVSQENDSEASGGSISNDDHDFLSVIENAKNKTRSAPGLNQDQIWKYDVRDD